jgi:hypothetical protein
LFRGGTGLPVAAVSPFMTALVGEVSDDLAAHMFSTAPYLDAVAAMEKM